jgi:hypothetical protein
MGYLFNGFKAIKRLKALGFFPKLLEYRLLPPRRP